MGQGESTLQPSDVMPHKGDPGAAVPGLVRVFGEGVAMATELPLAGGAIELGRELASLSEAYDRRMSRRHARVEFDGRRFWVADLGSQNGTFADGEPLPAGAPREVWHVVRVGGSLFVPCADLRPFRQYGVKVEGGFVRGPAMGRLLAEVARAAELGLSLHIHGESGTGKEGVARAFHESGPRRRGPFVAVNCATLPANLAEAMLFGAKRGAYSGAVADAEGYLVAADGGTLFLDEIGELDLAVQAKLLRALESREVTALGATKPKAVSLHLCSATHKDLRSEVATGRMREDLFFRIGRPEVRLPPVRQRPEELSFLLERELGRVAPELTPHVSLVEACLLRPWPGNVRELLVETRSAAQTALLQGDGRVEARHLALNAGAAFRPPPPVTPPPEAEAPPPAEEKAARRAGPSPAKPLDARERARIEAALREQGGSVRAASKALGMHRTQLRRLIDRYAIAVPAGGDDD